MYMCVYYIYIYIHILHIYDPGSRVCGPPLPPPKGRGLTGRTAPGGFPEESLHFLSMAYVRGGEGVRGRA